VPPGRAGCRCPKCSARPAAAAAGRVTVRQPASVLGGPQVKCPLTSAAPSVAAPFTEQGLRTIRPASTAVSMIRPSSR
jgi:hypothetical protein